MPVTIPSEGRQRAQTQNGGESREMTQQKRAPLTSGFQLEGLPLQDGGLQEAFQGRKARRACAGAHEGRAVLLHVPCYLPQPCLARLAGALLRQSCQAADGRLSEILLITYSISHT